ncbi:MAG: response regulator transcription factor [Terrabacter sp.]|nr:response regulator transcription factor [Terrabacter sp.]
MQGNDRGRDDARVDGPRTVLVVDDHKTFADLLELALQRDPALDCVGVAYSIESALDRFDDLEPDIAVMDHRFAGSDLTGVDAAAVMIERRPDTQVVLLTAHADRRMLRDAARVGIASVLPKDGNLADLRAVLVVRPTGGLVVHPALLKSLVESTDADGRLPNLSAREAETLDLLTLGLDVRMIADQMGVSVNTCRAYVKSVLAKLHAHSQLEAVAIARRNGWTAEDGRR